MNWNIRATPARRQEQALMNSHRLLTDYYFATNTLDELLAERRDYTIRTNLMTHQLITLYEELVTYFQDQLCS